jgi:hypothetical protein
MRIMGRPRALVAAVAGALLLAGCGSGPSQVGAATILGDQSFGLDRVQSMIDQAVHGQPYAQKLARENKLVLLGREIVRQAALHQLITYAAKKENLVADQAKIAQIAATLPGAPVADTGQGDQLAVAQIAANVRDRGERASDTYLERQLAAKFLPKLAVSADYVGFGVGDPNDPEARARAFDVAKQFAADPTKVQAAVQAAGQELQQSQQTGQPGPNGFSDAGLTSVFGAAQYPALAETVLFGSPANSVIAFQPRMPAKPDWYVFVLRSRGTDQAVPADGEPQKPTDDQLTAIGTRLLQPYVGESGLRVNPRYGVWDVVTMDVVPNLDAAPALLLPFGGPGRTQQ